MRESGCALRRTNDRFIDSDLLRRHLPKQHKRFQYFICGPLAMMDAMEKVLPGMGIAPEHIHTERFDIG